ncbi:MAG: hypothetical protein AB1473_23285 [Thermodesulfobacteriota bacterium]
MFATDQQRRWWFATHPEYSQSQKGEGAGKDKERGEDPDKVSPKDVDYYVGNALKYVDGPVADLLKSVKRHFGTEAEAPDTSSSQDNGGEDAAKEAFIKQLMDAGWKREWAESRWKAYKLYKSTGWGTALAVGMYGAIAAAARILGVGYGGWAATGRMATSAGTFTAMTSVTRGSLNRLQLQNLQRFEKRLPAAASETEIYKLPGGGRVFRAEVPGKVPRSKAIYEKRVDAAGRTTGYTKTTVDPEGKVVHVKDKFNR